MKATEFFLQDDTRLKRNKNSTLVCNIKLAALLLVTLITLISRGTGTRMQKAKSVSVSTTMAGIKLSGPVLRTHNH